MPNYTLSLNAQNSLRNIKTYSLNNFGKRQTNIYLRLIEGQLQAIAENPNTGRSRGDIKHGYFSIFAGSHVIFYRKASDHIEIIDILHQSMEPTKHL